MTCTDAMTDLPRIAREADASELPRFRAALAEADSIALSRLVTAALPADANGNARLPAEALAEDCMLTYGEAAKVLRVSESYVETLVRQGKLPAVTLPATAKGTGDHRRERAGRLKRIRRSALRELVS